MHKHWNNDTVIRYDPRTHCTSTKDQLIATLAPVRTQPEISMDFISGFLTFSLGTVTVSTPFSMDAFTWSTLAFSGSRNRRRNLPLLLSTRCHLSFFSSFSFSPLLSFPPGFPLPSLSPSSPSYLFCCLLVLFVRSRGFRLFFPSRNSILKMKGGKGKGTTKKETKEALKPADDRKVGKRKAAIKAEKSNKRRAKKEQKAKKDPNKPKRPPSAFFVFLEEFRKQYKQEHPNVKAVSVVGKAGGEKWKSLSDAEKAPYEAKAAKRKSEYEKQMSAYNKKEESVADDGDEESDRSKSEVNDEDEEESGEEEEDEDED